MTTIKAPFNFVPLSDKVFFPNWADQISQDIPFEDGVSGKIDITITAKTPIFVRNGHGQNEDKDERFSQTPDGKSFFIPATSIKGELRTLLEIMSFGKMKVDKKRYAMRDLQLRNYRDRFVYENIHCGWMTLKNDVITISDRGIPYRISHEEIDEKFKPREKFCTVFGKDAQIKDENKTAEYKYGLVDHQILNKSFNFHTFKIAEASVDKRMGTKVSDNGGDLEGKIVFTGQPGPRKPGRKYFDKKKNQEVVIKSTGKFWEFVFPETETYCFQFDWYGDIMEDFKFIYKDSTDWKYWKKKLTKGESIPVFMCVENNEIKSMGISYLYKLPFDKRINEMLPVELQNKKFDLAECIFGSIDGTDSLRGRVQVSNAICTDPKNHERIVPYMASPKPTYYPIYLQQNGNNGYVDKNFTTMLNSNARLKGRKMYPVRGNLTEFYIPEGQDNNTNPANPLGEGSKFKYSIRYHNLKRVELGALLYAIELRNNCYHSIGSFKPYGYGVCSYTITSILNEKESFKHEFQALMDKNIENYTKSEQMVEFWSMLNICNSENLKEPLEYMELDDFVECKRHNPKKEIYGKYLPWYSELVEKTKQSHNTPQYASEVITTTVTYWDKGIYKVKLDNRINVEFDTTLKVKCKIGDIIKVKVERSKKGKIMKVVFVEKIK